MRVSLMMLTIDRYEMTTDTWRKNISHATINLHPHLQLEHLVCDNGSKDRRIVDYFAEERGIHYHRVNSTNEGCGRAFNQLFLRATGDYLVLLGNDLLNGPGWLDECIRYADKVPDSGIVGIDWGHGHIPPVSERGGIHAHWLTPQLNRVFGTWVMRREVIEKVGFFCEDYGPYGLEDSDFNERVNRAKLQSLYVPNAGIKSTHLGHDVGEDSAYRKMKDESLARNLPIFNARMEQMNTAGWKPEPLPPMRDPL